MRIIIGGDFCVTPDYLSKNLFQDDLIELFEQSEYNVINLECPITSYEKKNKIIKTGPHLRSDKRINGHLKRLHVNVLTLANNHILDFGQKGLNDTIEFCQSNDIDFVGAGKNIYEAQKPLYLDKNGLKISIINFCENEWSIADINNGGANPLSLIDNVNQIKSAKKQSDFVIVIVHGGHEYYNLPSPKTAQTYRFFAENGADAILGHHTHCIGGWEIYNDVPIIYSLGNFLFTKNNRNKSWYIGLLASLDITKDNKINFNLHPIQQEVSTFKTSLLSRDEAAAIIQQINDFNKIIVDEKQLQNCWHIFLSCKRSEYLKLFSPIHAINHRRIKGLMYRLKMAEFSISKNHLKLLLNIMRCEAHAEIAINAIEQYLREKK